MRSFSFPLFAFCSGVGACGGGSETAEDGPRCRELDIGRICVSLAEEDDDQGSLDPNDDDDRPSEDDTNPGGAQNGDPASGGRGSGGEGSGGRAPTTGDGTGGEPEGTGGVTRSDVPCSFSGRLRDFSRTSHAHTDFVLKRTGLALGLVEPELDEERKPVFSGIKTELVTSSESFSQWYRDNSQAYDVQVEFRAEGGVYRLGSERFFPLDGYGFGNQGSEHNFGFTTELWGEFVYDPDEDAYFSIDGDDDLWVFIDGRLVIDLGGIHFPERATVHLADVAEKLDLEPGENYQIALFHAERRPEGSIFSIETTIEFSRDCQ